ncbi:MAG: glycosyltransferase [Bacteroidales bacterium]|nr:glycosyltransferase [Bacteroidales bacterium]
MKHDTNYILFLPRWFPHTKDPMFGLFVKKHAEAVSLFRQVAVVYVQGLVDLDNVSKVEISEKPNYYSITYYYRNSKCSVWNVLRYFYYNLRGFLAVKTIFGKADAVHVHILTRLGLFAFFLKAVYGIPYLITEHWSRYQTIPGTYTGCFRKNSSSIVVKYASAVLPISENLATAMKSHKLNNGNYHIVPNVVDDGFFQKKSRNSASQITTFIHVSTFEDRSKNIRGILKSLKLLSERNSDFLFWFVGDGMDFDKMKQFSDALGLDSSKVLFLGLKEGVELIELYNRADYLVLFSRFENIPVVINEALSCGLPVISSNVGGVSEYINETNGFLVDSEDTYGLSDILQQVIVKAPSFNKLKIQEKAIKKFSYSSVGNQLNKIYNSI